MASNRTIIFGLRDIYDLKVKDTYFTASSPGSPGVPAISDGYWAGGRGWLPYLAPVGSGAANQSGNSLLATQRVRKIEFSTSTLTSPGSGLPSARMDLAGISGLPVSKGYFGGGYRFPANFAIDNIDSVDLTNDTTARASSLNKGRLGAGGASVDNQGYFGGGYSANPFTFDLQSYISSFERFSFETETAISFSSVLSTKRDGVRAVQTAIYGYFSGGQMTIPDGRLSSAIDRLEFFNDTMSVLSARVPQRAYHGVVSTADNGYFVGGGGGTPGVPGGPLNARTSRVERLDFSNETVQFAANLREAKEAISAVGSSSDIFAIGGFNNYVQRTIPEGTFNETVSVSSIDRIDYNTLTLNTAFPNSPETIASHGSFSAIRSSKAFIPSFSEQLLGTNYYWKNDFASSYIGGGIPSPVATTKGSTISRLEFESETIVDFGTQLRMPIGKSDPTGVSNTKYTYIAGGSKENISLYGTTYAKTSSMDRIESATATRSAGLDLISSRDKSASASTSNYGYFVGGDSGFLSSNVVRLDFSTELSGTLSNTLFAFPGPTYRLNYSLSSVYDTDYGYFAGGRNDSRNKTSTITRLTFSDNTFTILLANLSTQRDSSLSAMSSYYGYIAGGNESGGIINTIDRIDFATSTLSASPFGLQTKRTRGCASATQNYGYFMMGETPTGDSSSIERLDFSNETISSPSGTFTRTAKSSLAAAVGEVRSKTQGDPSYGFIFAGSTPTGQSSNVYRLENFYGSLVSSLVSGPIGNEAKNYQAALGTNSSAYLIGGLNPSIVTTCTIDRVDFTTCVGKTISSTAPQAVDRGAGVSRGGYGYIAGGTNPPARTSKISRLDFATENMVERTSLSAEKARLCSVTNENYAYFGGGYTLAGATASVSTIERLEYNTETRSNPGALLDEEKHSAISMASNLNAYFFAGYNSASSPSFLTTHTKMDFSTETPSSLSASLMNDRYDAAGLSFNTEGYSVGGKTSTSPLATNHVRLVNFNSDTISTETSLPASYYTSETSSAENLQRS